MLYVVLNLFADADSEFILFLSQWGCCYILSFRIVFLYLVFYIHIWFWYRQFGFIRDVSVANKEREVPNHANE